MDAKIIEEKNVYLYELNETRFKEIHSTLRLYDNNKAVIVRDDNGKAIYVSCEEGKVFKNKYVWLSGRNKEKAGKIFNIQIKMDILKLQESLNQMHEREKLISKYLDLKKK